jgi:chromosome segregation ATPase
MLILIIAIIEIALVAFGLWYVFNKKIGAAYQSLTAIKEQILERKKLKSDIEERADKMVNIEVLAFAVTQYRKIEAEFETEKTKVALVQSDLDMSEKRLRELEEMEREIQNSRIDLEQELEALKSKESQLRNKNDKLKTDITESMQYAEELIWEIELSAQIIEQVKFVKSHLIATEDKIEKLLLQIEEANKQYSNLKIRYDALDIEYAQLYEKSQALENQSKARANS